MKHILVIGGGVAGLEASKKLAETGYNVSIVEHTGQLGGKLNQWDRLFPDNVPSKEVFEKIQKGMPLSVYKYLNSKVQSIQKKEHLFKVNLSNGIDIIIDAILVSTGFDIFNAGKKEEYGYGIYSNVITSADLEERWRNNKKLCTSNGKIPKRVGFFHCVGSRDEKAGNKYCSKASCLTAIKQASRIKELLPECEVFCFYMDLQIFGRHFERNYQYAQEKHGIQFIRGRLSECFENPDGTVLLKVEDTLLGKPMRINTDLVILMAGMVPSSSSNSIKEIIGLESDDNGFFSPLDSNYDVVSTNIPGIFVAGACTGPKTIENTINEARAAAGQINAYLSDKVIK